MQFSDRLHQMRMQAKTLRRSIEQLETTGRETLQRLGIKPVPSQPEAAIVDVGAPLTFSSRLPVLLKKGVQGLVLGTSFALLGVALLFLGMFTGAAALAYVFITRGLGLRITPTRAA